MCAACLIIAMPCNPLILILAASGSYNTHRESSLFRNKALLVIFDPIPRGFGKISSPVLVP